MQEKSDDTRKEADAKTEARWAQHAQTRGIGNGPVSGLAAATPFVDEAYHQRQSALHMARALSNEPVSAEKLIADAKAIAKYLANGE